MATNNQVYYNRYNSVTNKYKKIRFISARGQQSSEHNELQEILLENNREIFNTLFTNGSIVSGGNINRDGLTLSIEAGIIYYDGLTVKVPAGIITLIAGEDDDIGVLLSENIITSTNNPDLLNPAVETLLYKQKGADRLEIVGEWKKSSESSNLASNQKFFPRYTVVEGNLNESQLQPKTEIQNTQALLEKYDYDSNGNYVINGLGVFYDSALASENKYLLSVKDGLCHVNGKEFSFPFINKVKINYPLVTREVIGEPTEYLTSKTVYTLRNYPIANISQILAMKLVTLANVTHGSFTGSTDLLPNTPVASVILVKQGSTTYVRDVDYTVVGDSINWSLNGAEPTPGSTYQVTFTYVSTAVSFTINSDLQSLTIPTTNGLQNSSSIFFTYTYYLPRKDRIIVNKAGALEVMEGYPVPLNPIPPTLKEGLSLATVSLLYNTLPEITLDTFKVFKMSDFQIMQSRLDKIDYNISQLSLAEDIKATDPTISKIDLFVDSFLDDDLRDAGQTQNATIVGQTLIPFVHYQQKNIYQGPEQILDYTTAYAINQDAFTKARQVNEFTWSSAPPANIIISPASYRWVASEVIKDVWEPAQSRQWPPSSAGNRIWLNGRTLVDTTSNEQFVEIHTEIPAFAFNITGGKWNFNEIIDVYFDSKLAQTINADGTGFVNYNFAIPVGTQSGNIPVKLVGRVSGVIAEATFSAVPLSRIITKRHQTFYVWNDPIAQTFTLTKDTFVKSVELYFEANSTNFVDVFITKTIVGFPDRTKAVARKRLYPQQIMINQWQEFVFEEPVLLESEVEYAVIVECTDPAAKVKVAELGKFADNVGRYLTGQAFDSGVLLNSANGSTWSAIQNEDLAFKLKSCVFSGSKTIILGSTHVTSATDLILLTGVDIPAGTDVKFQAVLLDRANETYDISPYANIEISSYTGDIQVKAILSTNFSNISPGIEGDVLLSVGTVVFPSNYISRVFPITSTSTKISCIIDVNEPSPSFVDVQYKNASNVWVSLTRLPAKSTQIGNGWVRIYLEANISGLSTTAIQVVLNSADNTQRPYARNLRAYTN